MPVILEGELGQVGRGLLRPHAAEHLEGVGGDVADVVVGGAHDGLHPEAMEQNLPMMSLSPNSG